MKVTKCVYMDTTKNEYFFMSSNWLLVLIYIYIYIYYIEYLNMENLKSEVWISATPIISLVATIWATVLMGHWVLYIHQEVMRPIYETFPLLC
jgi:uncharacterized membrane protein